MRLAQNYLFVAKHEQRNHNGVKLLKLYMKNYMILLSMDVGVHFV